MRVYIGAFAMMLAAGSAGATCAPLPGASAVLANAATRYLVVGEMHGSNEEPRLFGELVCHALADGRQVVVGLERSTSEQAALDDVLVGSDLHAAEAKLIHEPGWTDIWDGRSSGAMLDLMVRLRTLRAADKSLQVIALDGPVPGSEAGARDKVLGQSILTAAEKNPRSMVIVLMGNAHTMLKPVFGYATAAMSLPQQQTVALEITDAGGTIWADVGAGCGPVANGLPGKPATAAKGIYLDASLAPIGVVDGVLSVGGTLTASLPAADRSRPAPCFVKYEKLHPGTNVDAGPSQTPRR